MMKDCRVKMANGNVYAAIGSKAISFTVNPKQSKSQSKQAAFHVDSGCSDHKVNSLDCMQSVRKLIEPFVIDVTKGGVSIVGKYESEVKGMSKEGDEERYFRARNQR